MHPRNLYFLVTREHSYTIDHHLQTWGRSLASFLRPLFYDELTHYRSLRPGTYIFSDLERLTRPQLEMAAAAWDALQQSGQPVQLLNNPHNVLRREALLRALHKDGVNPFRVYRLNEDIHDARYPLFVRRDNEHDGSLSELVHSAADLPRAVAAARSKGVDDSDLLLVEHCNTADQAGIYRKYAAFRIGQRCFPFHINFSRNWVVKRNECLTPELEAEEIAYRASTECVPQLRAVFERAHVDYGRIDYSLLNGRMVVWEINTNPSLGGDPFRAKPHRLPLIHSMVRDINECLIGLRPAIDAAPADSIPLNLPGALLRQLGVGTSQQWARQARRALRRLAASAPWRRAAG